MGDTYIFSFGKAEKVPITIDGTDTLDDIKGRLFYRGKLADIERNLFTIILKCAKGSNDFTEIKTTKQLKEYRVPGTNEVNSEIHVSFPETYQSDTPFKISDALSADNLTVGNGKAWGYHIFLEAGKTLRIIPEIDYAPTAYIRWSTLCSDKSGKVKKRGLNIVYSSIEAAYEFCQGDSGNITYKDKMKNIEKLMKTPMKENFYSESPETRSNRVNRLYQVFNVEVVEIAKVLDENRRFDFINEISGKIEQYSSTPLAQSSAKKAQEPSAKASLEGELWQGLQSLPKARAAEIHGALNGVIEDYNFLIGVSELVPTGGVRITIKKSECKTLDDLKKEIKLRLKMRKIDISGDIEISKRGSSKMITSLKEIKDKQIILIHKKPTAQVAAEASVEAEGEREAPPTVDTPVDESASNPIAGPDAPKDSTPTKPSSGSALAAALDAAAVAKKMKIFVLTVRPNQLVPVGRELMLTASTLEEVLTEVRNKLGLREPVDIAPPVPANSEHTVIKSMEELLKSTKFARDAHRTKIQVWPAQSAEIQERPEPSAEIMKRLVAAAADAGVNLAPKLLDHLTEEQAVRMAQRFENKAAPKVGGYRDPPKRKKRKNIRRKNTKRKNIRRKSNKRKNTKRKITKRKITKRKITKRKKRKSSKRE